MGKPLTQKQELFCNYYVECGGNASEAYRRAYNVSRMKEKTINQAASRTLSDCKVAARVNELQSELKEKSDITKERVLDELGAIMEAKITDYVNLVTKLVDVRSKKDIENEEPPQFVSVQRLVFKDFAELTERQVKAIESVKETRNGIELKLHGKSWTIERICKMLGYDAPARFEGKMVSEFEGMTDEELENYVYGTKGDDAKG